MKRSDCEDIFDANQCRYVDEWIELLSFASIGTDPECEQDCIDCAQWLATHLENIGFSAQILTTPARPVVYAERAGKAGKPTVLFYGHYDVQPVDPLEEWSNPPFDPVLKDGRVYARGAEDNKGQVLSSLKAMEALIQNDDLDVTIKVIIEGEEECGSVGITHSLPKWADMVKADVLMVADTNTVITGAPTIIMGLRGLIYLTATLHGPSHDLHSGLHGGCAPNPAAEMARLIASLHNDNGSIAVEGFYDMVSEPSERERSLAAAAPFDVAAYEHDTGAPPVAGEKQFSPVERLGFRPSIDITGIHSGFGGKGVKTVIPARAMAKITARLVPNQDSTACLNSIIQHLKDRVPEGMRIEITDEGGVLPGFRLDPDSAIVKKTMSVFAAMSEKEPAFLWEGASIPVVVELARVSGAKLLMVGFGSEEDRIHAPNESYSIDQFKEGFIYTCLMLTSL